MAVSKFSIKAINEFLDKPVTFGKKNVLNKPTTDKKKPLTKEQLKEQSENKKKQTETLEKFYDIMFELKLHDQARNTYNLVIDEKTSYGFKARLFLVAPLTFKKLSEHINVLEENLKCIWIMKYEKFGECAFIKIVTEPLDPEVPFENPNIRPWQMYLGLNFLMKAITIDMNKNNMFLIAGATGSGKTRFICCMLLSWITGCSVNEIELYLADIAKDEFINFKYVKHVKYYASEIEQLQKMLQVLKIKFEKRKKTISRVREEGTATNIQEYNKISKVKMPYVIILIDEASILNTSHGDSKEVIAMKQEIIDTLCVFSKTCRSYGMFPVLATQKTVKDEIPSIIKDMAAVRISFRANGGKSSESILGDDSAVGLLDRYAIYSLDGGCTKDYLFSPKLTTEMLNRLLQPHIDKNCKKLDLDTIIKESKQAPQPDTKIHKPDKTKKPKQQHHEPINTASSKMGSMPISIVNDDDDEFI